MKAALFSFLRVFGAAAGAVYLTIGKAPLDLTASDYRDLANAGLAALALTLINYFRSGETRFGKSSEDAGMGGEDKLEPGGVDKTKTPPVKTPTKRVPKNTGGDAAP